MRRWTGPSLIQVMACRLFGAKPLSEPMLANCQLDSCEQISVKFKSKFYHFHSKNVFENVFCKIDGHSVQGGDELIYRLVHYVKSTLWRCPTSSGMIRNRSAYYDHNPVVIVRRIMPPRQVICSTRRCVVCYSRPNYHGTFSVINTQVYTIVPVDDMTPLPLHICHNGNLQQGGDNVLTCVGLLFFCP